ncbi:hypothetical protein HMI56_004575 [Coelomomyces lativittatus]|nr:hypothetical protein HMI56_004575 [Coelomomyces lativittatus]
MPYFTKGQWVPDRVVMDVIALRLGHPDVQKSGYVLQGFPKTRTQFQLMQKRGWLPTFCLALEFSETWLRERELQTYPRSSPSAALSEEGLQGLDALHHQATIQRLQTYQFHLQQLLSSSKSWIQVPIPYFNSFHHQLVTLAKTIHQRPPYRIPPVHRIYLVGGTHEQRHAISVMLESHYRLVYVSLQRLFLDTPTMDPSTLPMDQLVLKLKDLVSSPSLKTSGYVVNLEWTPTLIEESLNLPSPNRVIYIQGEGQVELYSCLVKCYKRMEHPLFYSVPTNGKLHEFQPTSDLIEKVRQGLLTPIPYWSAFCYLERKEKDEESESKKTYE